MSFQWLETEFLGYLREWDERVAKRQGFSKKQKAKLKLSLETITGLRMTGEICRVTVTFYY